MVVRIRVGYLGCVFPLNSESDHTLNLGDAAQSPTVPSTSRHTHTDLAKYVDGPTSQYACTCSRTLPPPTIHWSVPNSRVIAIDTPHFSGELVIRIRRFAYKSGEEHPASPKGHGNPHPTDSSLSVQNPDQDPYFRTRKRVFAFQLRGRFKPTNLARPDLGYRWTGRDVNLIGHCDRKLVNVPLTIRIATEFVRMFDSSFSAAHMLDKEQPWVSTPVLASMDALATVTVGEGLKFKDVLAKGGRVSNTPSAALEKSTDMADDEVYPPSELRREDHSEDDYARHSEFYRRLREITGAGKPTDPTLNDARSKYAGSDDSAATDKTLILAPGLSQAAVHPESSNMDLEPLPAPGSVDPNGHAPPHHDGHESHGSGIGNLARRTSEMLKHALSSSHTNIHHTDPHHQHHHQNTKKGHMFVPPHYPPLPLPAPTEPWIPASSIPETVIFGADPRKCAHMETDARVKARKKFFSDLKEQEAFVFHEDTVYEMEFYQAYVDMNDMRGKIGISIDGLRYTDSQPLRLSFATPDRRAEFFTLEFVYE
ncbi:hypothetical protein HDU93_008697 [Gonapodya sp. JEL0774]|nr:hypothetical protein HDU93_008697 [Gonapodya sp. JEL0774]